MTDATSSIQFHVREPLPSRAHGDDRARFVVIADTHSASVTLGGSDVAAIAATLTGALLTLYRDEWLTDGQRADVVEEVAALADRVGLDAEVAS